jgi:hypothetical protein
VLTDQGTQFYCADRGEETRGERVHPDSQRVRSPTHRGEQAQADDNWQSREVPQNLQ